MEQMIPRSLIVTTVFGLPILALTFGVVLGASALAGELGDVAFARGLFLAAIGALVLLVIDVLALLVILGLRALEEPE
jgi:hypothetical protein